MSVVFLPCIRSRLGRFMEPKLALLVTAPRGPLLVILPIVVLIEISCRISFTSWLLISIYKTTPVKTSSVLANIIKSEQFESFIEVRINNWNQYEKNSTKTRVLILFKCWQCKIFWAFFNGKLMEDYILYSPNQIWARTKPQWFCL